MKKLFALVLAVCLCACCVSALADARTSYEFDAFTLTTDGQVASAEKIENQIFMTYYPLSGQGNMLTNINAVWVQSNGLIVTGDLVGTIVLSQKDTLIAQMTAAGMPVTDFELTGTADIEYWGISCAQADYKLNCSISGFSMTMELRQIAVPYTADDIVFLTITTLTDADAALLTALNMGDLLTLDQLTEVLVADIEWKK